MPVEIKSTVRNAPLRLAYMPIKEKVLGASYELSLVFVGSRRMRTLNRTYRNKDKTTDILSFSLTKNSGEIFICLDKVRNQIKKLGGTLNNRVAFLFIHGLHHLKGLDHGSRMDKEEMAIRSIFGIKN